MKRYILTIIICLSVYSGSARSSTAPKDDNAVILVYHHVADTTPPSTSVSPEVFEQHLAYLAEHFTVLPLTEVVNALQNGQKLPRKTIAITFDDGYNNLLHNAHPLLTKYQFPYTIFINPERIAKEPGQLTWDEVKFMERQGVLFANHTLDHLHMLDRHQGESKQQWLERVWANVAGAQKILASKLNFAPKYLAYPFGEYNEALASKLSAEGYIGFAQHSGAISSASDFTALPRFPAAGIYANLKTLAIKMNSLAMPITKLTHSDPEIPRDQVKNLTFGFSIASKDVRTSQLQCFYKGTNIDFKADKHHFNVTLPEQLPTGRSRVNCTAPGKAQPGRYYWYSKPFFVARADGTYPD